MGLGGEGVFGAQVQDPREHVVGWIWQVNVLAFELALEARGDVDFTGFFALESASVYACAPFLGDACDAEQWRGLLWFEHGVKPNGETVNLLGQPLADRHHGGRLGLGVGAPCKQIDIGYARFAVMDVVVEFFGQILFLLCPSRRTNQGGQGRAKNEFVFHGFTVS